MKTFLKITPMLLLALSCTGWLNPDGGDEGISGAAGGHEMIVLGNRLEDPYTVDNVAAAIASLYPTRAGRVAVDPTDLYVRFLPSDDADFSRLEKLGLMLVDHPVDYEIIREGDYYHDPSVGDDKITWQYAVVKKDFKFPEGIKYELIDKCYISDGAQTTKSDGIDWAAVGRESFRLTCNESMLSVPAKGSGQSSGTPEGRISIVDDAIGGDPAGVKGVMVSCNSFVKFARAYTDEEGNYKMTRNFSSNPRYRIVFKNSKGFGLGFNLLLVPGSFSTLGQNPPSGVDVTVDKNSERKLFARCVVNNAAYDYYESCSSGDNMMKAPPANLRIWLFQNLQMSSSVMLQQGALVDDSIVSDYLGEYSALLKMFLPDITLGLKGKNDYASIYPVVVHELAHASHFQEVGKTYWNPYIMYILKSFVTSGFVTYGVGTEDNHGYCEIGEMWAYYLETILYRERYRDTDAVFGTSFWFSPQIFMNLDDRGLDRFKIFKALTSDVTDRAILQKKLTSLYPELKSAINQAFTRYN